MSEPRDIMAEAIQELYPDSPPIEYGKGKLPFRAATVRALHIVEREDKLPPGDALTAIAVVGVRQAMNGDKESRRDIADRLDGKPAQEVTANGSITHNHIHEAISATDAWLAGFITGAKASQAAELMPDRPLLPAPLCIEQK